MKFLRALAYWIVDYFYAARAYAAMLFSREPARYRRGESGRRPIVLIPGIMGRWQALKFFSDALARRGNPVYMVRELGFNMKAIEESARRVRDCIERENLRDVVIVAHSKGGIVGKYLLAHFNSNGRVKKLIAIATPFAGSRLALPFRGWREFSPEGTVIKELQEARSVNTCIVSIYGTFDNHVWPLESCVLEGAKNIQVPVNGHNKMLFDRRVLEIVEKEAERV